MSHHREEHLELCAALVLGALDESDRIELAAHRAAGCPECEREIVRLEAAAQLLARSAPAATPSPALRARTLAAVAAEARAAAGASRESEHRILPLPERRGSAWMPWVFAAAAAFLAVASIMLWREGEELRGSLETTRRDLATSQQRLLEEQRWTAVLDALDARAVSLAPTPDGAADLRGRGTWDPATRRAVIVFDHVAAPTGHDYQLWGIHPGGPRSLGVVRPDASGRAIVRLEDAGDPATLQAFAISLEPEGGSPNPNAPSGPVVMVGRVPS